MTLKEYIKQELRDIIFVNKLDEGEIDDIVAVVEDLLERQRIKCANSAKLTFTPYDEEPWEDVGGAIKTRDILDFYSDGENDEWAVQQILERDDFEINVDKESILNCSLFAK